MKVLCMVSVLVMCLSAHGKSAHYLEVSDNESILIGQSGLSLYTFDVDGPNQSNCSGGCLQVWPAVIVDSSEQLLEPFGSILLESGQLQLTINQKPLYTYVGDKVLGDINGDNIGGVWHLVKKEIMECFPTEQTVQDKDHI